MEFFILILKLILTLAIVFGLMILTLRYSKKGINKINAQKYVKIIDRVQIAKDIYVVILKIGDEGQVVLMSSANSEVLKKLTSEELKEIEDGKNEAYENMTNAFKNIKAKIKSLISLSITLYTHNIQTFYLFLIGTQVTLFSKKPNWHRIRNRVGKSYICVYVSILTAL